MSRREDFLIALVIATIVGVLASSIVTWAA